MKARIVGSVLVFLLLWPLVHRQLVTRYDTNPWKLFGLAMYCTPHNLGVQLDGIRAGRVEPIFPAELPASAQQALGHFASLRRVLGQFHSAEAMARAVLDARPEFDAVEVVIQIYRLPPLETHIEAQETRHRFER